MPEPKMIKATAEVNCPHCSNKILISFRSYLPAIDWALKDEDLKTAKDKLVEGIEKVSFNNPKKKEEILSQLNRGDFMVGPEEVTPILEQILKDNVTEKDETKKN